MGTVTKYSVDGPATDAKPQVRERLESIDARLTAIEAMLDDENDE